MVLGIFATRIHGQSVPVPQFQQNTLASLPSFFDSIVPKVEQELCQYIGSKIIRGTLTGDAEYDVAIAELTTFCLGVIDTIEALTGVAEAVAATGFGLVALQIGNGLACKQLVGNMLLPGQYAEARQICSILVSDLNPTASMPPVSASVTGNASPTAPVVSATSVSTAVSTSPANPSTGATLPIGTALAQDPCVSCQLSAYFVGVQQGAQQCHVAVPFGFSNDISTIFCDPSIVGSYRQLCASLCADPCSTYNAATWIQEAGAGFMIGASLPLCSQLCPNFKGTGKLECVLIPPCNQCGLGAATCVPC
jgi:hypothetical protein